MFGEPYYWNVLFYMQLFHTVVLFFYLSLYYIIIHLGEAYLQVLLSLNFEKELSSIEALHAVLVVYKKNGKILEYQGLLTLANYNILFSLAFPNCPHVKCLSRTK